MQALEADLRGMVETGARVASQDRREVSPCACQGIPGVAIGSVFINQYETRISSLASVRFGVG
jgi:hypothetical protein